MSSGFELDPHNGHGHGGAAFGYGDYDRPVMLAQHAYTVLGPISEENDFMQTYDTSGESVYIPDIDAKFEQEAFDAVEEIELAVRDVAEWDYIDHARTPNGIHCMDYCMNEPGIQLPGGELWTRVANLIMDPESDVMSMEEAIGIATYRLQELGIVAWVHPGCAAAKNLIPALITNEKLMSQARDDFVIPILTDLDLTYSGTERDIDTAILVGSRRAENETKLLGRLDPENEDGTKLAVELGLPFEHLDKSGAILAGGLGIFTTPNLFNNLRFRQNHRTSDGREVGMYAVTPGAYRDMLAARGESGLSIARTVTGAILLTHGLARYLGGDYLRARVVAPKT